MTLIVGLQTEQGLIVASDGLAFWNMLGQEHLPKEQIDRNEKIHIVGKTVVYGVAGSMVNWNERLRVMIATLLEQNPKQSLENISVFIANRILPDLYSQRMNHPDFYISLFIAGFSPGEPKPQMYTIDHGDVLGWGDDHPWMTVGNNNQISDSFIREHYNNELFNHTNAISIAKDAIAHSSEQMPDVIGGHIFVYEITQNGVHPLE